MSLSQQHQKIIEFAEEHNFVENPTRSFEELARVVVKLGHCPCSPKRKKCPCEFAEEEVSNQGYCLCWGFLHPDFNYRKGKWQR